MLGAKRRAAATAPNTTQQKQSYCNRLPESSMIELLLAGLLFGLQYPHLTSSERVTVLDAIDGLLRLRIDLKRIKEGHCG